MSDPSDNLTSLHGDTLRQAISSTRGYVFQIWHSFLAWIDLADNQALYLEKAEDFDVVEPGRAEATQVKHTDTDTSITLRSKSAREAISNYWKLRQKHPQTKVQLRLLTNAHCGIEKGAPFGKGNAGIEVWRRAKRDQTSIKLIRKFLICEDWIPSDLRTFVANADDAEVLNSLIAPIDWYTGAMDMSGVVEAVHSRLIALAANYGIAPKSALRAANALFADLINVVANEQERKLTKADLLKKLSEETQVTISERALSKLLERQSLPLPHNASAMELTSPVLGTIFSRAAPPLPEVAQRTSLVNDVRAQLAQGNVVALIGSSGMGKSTLASLICDSIDRPSGWASFRDIESTRLKYSLQQLPSWLNDNPDIETVVLDDVEFPPNSRKVENELIGLRALVRNRRGSLLITSQRSVPQSLQILLFQLEHDELAVPPLLPEDVTELLKAYGCSDASKLKSNAGLVLIQTSGHPQLVHAHIRALAKRGFPKLSLVDLLNPLDSEGVQSEARRVLSDSPVDGAADLACRLSTVPCAIERRHALALAEIPDAIDLPGEAFDYLVGPWLERQGGNRYLISPLLKNAASESWGPEKLLSFRRSAAYALAKDRHPTVELASAILLNALIGEASDILLGLGTTIIKSKFEVQRAFASSCRWFLAYATDEGQLIYSSDRSVNMILRTAQYALASAVDNHFTKLVADRWNLESLARSDDPVEVYYRAHFCVSMLIRDRGVHSAGALIDMALEAARLLSGVATELSRLVQTVTDSAAIPNLPIAASLFLLVAARCDSLDMLEGAIDRLSELDSADRSDLLSALSGRVFLAHMFIGPSWANETQETDPDWDRTIALLSRLEDLSHSWGHSELEAAAIKGLAAIYDEHLGQTQDAITIVRRGIGSLGSLPFLEDELALIKFHAQDYSGALEIWDRIVENWDIDLLTRDTTAQLATQNAAVAAAYLEHWSRSAELFLAAAAQADRLSLSARSTTLRVDAAFSLWKAESHERALVQFSEILYELENSDTQEKAPDHFRTQKLLGHIVIWLAYNERDRDSTLLEPRPGVCSTTQPTPELLQLVSTPTDMIWMNLLELEMAIGLHISNLDNIRERLCDSDSASVRYFAKLLRLKKLLDTGQVETIGTVVCDIEQENQKAKQEALDFGVPDNSKKELVYPKYGVTFLIMTAALFAAIVSEKDIQRCIYLWRDALKGEQSEELENWFALAETLSLDVDEAVQILRDELRSIFDLFLAAVLVGTSTSSSPDESFYAHVFVLTHFHDKDIGLLLNDLVAAPTTSVWKSHAATRLFLRNPMRTAPSIAAACDSPTTSWSKLATILLAAEPATLVRVPEQVRQTLLLLTDRKRPKHA